MSDAAILERSQALPQNIPQMDFDPYDVEVLKNPYPYHEMMREAGPVVWIRKYGCWAVTRYEEVRTVLNDYQTYVSSAGVGYANFRTEEPFRPPSLVLEADPPAHTRARKPLAAAISNKALAQHQEEFTKQAKVYVDRALEMGEIDGSRDLAVAYPLKVFPDAVGLAPDGRETLLDYGNIVFNAIGPHKDNAVFADATKNAAAVTEWIMAHCAREALSPGGFGMSIYEFADRGELTEDEAGMLVRSLLSAGVDTTVSGIGNALYLFSKNPDQWAKLHEDPSLTRHAFEEAIRLESPVQAFFRTASKDTELSGVKINAWDKVMCYYASANRDPRRWENPDKFDITRNAQGHLAFGTGVHRCVGRVVAWVEADALLGELARRVKAIEPTGEPVLRAQNAIRVFDSIPMRLIPA